VTGHPGIGLPAPFASPPTNYDVVPGKSVFLLRLLIRRLSLGLPTALQIVPEYALLFCNEGVYKFGQLGDQGPYSKMHQSTGPYSRIWALIDSNVVLIQPAGAFMSGRPFFVVEAASPRYDRFQWMKKVYGERFYMKPWSFPEVCQAYVHFSPLDRHNVDDYTPAAAHSSSLKILQENATSGTYIGTMEHLPGCCSNLPHGQKHTRDWLPGRSIPSKTLLARLPSRQAPPRIPTSQCSLSPRPPIAPSARPRSLHGLCSKSYGAVTLYTKLPRQRSSTIYSQGIHSQQRPPGGYLNSRCTGRSGRGEPSKFPVSAAVLQR